MVYAVHDDEKAAAVVHGGVQRADFHVIQHERGVAGR
jgi:hypothetical protein